MAAKIEHRRLEASYGGGVAVAVRGDQSKREREREKRDLACSQLQQESQEQTYRDGGASNRLGDVGSSR